MKPQSKFNGNNHLLKHWEIKIIYGNSKSGVEQFNFLSLHKVQIGKRAQLKPNMYKYCYKLHFCKYSTRGTYSSRFRPITISWLLLLLS